MRSARAAGSTASREARSTYGECTGTLSWQIVDGRERPRRVGPWRCARHLVQRRRAGIALVVVLHLDERADEPRRAVLEDIFTGRLEERRSASSLAFKPSNLLAVVPCRIETTTPRGGWFRAGASVERADRRAVRHPEPGDLHHPRPRSDRPGGRRRALEVHDEHFDLSYRDGRLRTMFDYSST